MLQTLKFCISVRCMFLSACQINNSRHTVKSTRRIPPTFFNQFFVGLFVQKLFWKCPLCMRFGFVQCQTPMIALGHRKKGSERYAKDCKVIHLQGLRFQ